MPQTQPCLELPPILVFCRKPRSKRLPFAIQNIAFQVSIGVRSLRCIPVMLLPTCLTRIIGMRSNNEAGAHCDSMEAQGTSQPCTIIRTGDMRGSLGAFVLLEGVNINSRAEKGVGGKQQVPCRDVPRHAPKRCEAAWTQAPAPARARAAAPAARRPRPPAEARHRRRRPPAGRPCRQKPSRCRGSRPSCSAASPCTAAVFGLCTGRVCGQDEQ